MNLANDLLTLRRLSTAQRGCFSKDDLATALAEPHPSALVRRLTALQAHGILTRVSRGWYVTADFDRLVLSQRLAPSSYLSLETVLGAHGVIGVRPEHRIVAVKEGKTRTYESALVTVEHLGVQAHLLFGWELAGTVKRATPEKALLDALHFYQHGRRLPFDPYSDVNARRLNRARLDEYLQRYKNPKFVAFVEKVLAS